MSDVIRDVLLTALRCKSLSITSVQFDCIAKTMRTLLPDKGAAIAAGCELIKFYGRPSLPPEYEIVVQGY